jgi:3-isopropylmalate/(R)-2-methylmalate dehydratase small subunit
MSDKFSAPKVWKFGDNIDTDQMLPGPYLWRSQEERARAVFMSSRPGWVDQMKKGDALVAGHNFGCGSSRPAALSLRDCGVSFVLAESIKGLMFRNAVNFGMALFECPGVTAAFEEGDGAEVTLADWTARNLRTGKTLKIKPIPQTPLSIMLSGGVIPLLEKRGMIAKAS